ncbi:MAG: helix-turn-helix protein [Clostridia bacterium]|jgi:AraC-like DNA-binding protein|nr:helix-turn-helix protein [Clostridia bacterium]
MDHDTVIIIPDRIVQICQDHPILSQLMVTHCGFYYKANGHFIERSGIPDYILIYCVDGEGWVRLNSNISPMKKGDIVIIPANTPHAYGADTANPWSIHWIHFIGKSVSLLLYYPLLSVGEQPRLIDCFNNLYPIFNLSYSETSMLKASAYLQLLLCELRELGAAFLHVKKDFKDIEKVVSLMQNNLNRTYSLEELSQYVNLSKYHFTRKFKAFTSYSPIEYFNRLKIQHACDLLIETDWTIEDISKYLSFNSPYYFSEQFKQITGYAPTKLRKIIKNKL